jgi:YVTN family beta-propeller protein
MSLKAQAAPVIVEFKGEVTVDAKDANRAKLALAWVTQGADTVTITNVKGIQEPFGITEIRPLYGVSFSTSYTLQASAGEAVTTSTIHIVWPASATQNRVTLPGQPPADCAILPNGARIFCAGPPPPDASLSVVDPVSLEVASGSPIRSGPSQSVAASPDSSRVYVGLFDGLAGYDAKTLEPVPGSPVHLPLPDVSQGIRAAVTPDNNRVYVSALTNNVHVYDASKLQKVGTIAVGGWPRGIAFTPDGKRAFVAMSSTSEVSVIDTASLAVVKSISGAFPESGSSCVDVAVTHDGKQLYVANNSKKSVSVFDLETYSELPGSPIEMPGNPVRLSPSPDGTLIFVLLEGSHSLSVVDPMTLTLVGSTGGLNGPYAMAVSPDGFRVFVTTRSDLNDPNHNQDFVLLTFLPTATGGTMSALEGKAAASLVSK